MILLMPTRQDAPNYTFSMDLENNTYNFEFLWNDRDQHWYFHISDAVGNRLLSGRRVAIGLPLIWRYRNPALPPGEFCAVDTSGQDVEALQNDLGTRVQLLYFESTDLPTNFVLNT